MSKAKILNSICRTLKSKYIPADLLKLEAFEDLKASITNGSFTMFETFLSICGRQLSELKHGRINEFEAVKTLIDCITDNLDSNRELTEYMREQRYMGVSN